MNQKAKKVFQKMRKLLAVFAAVMVLTSCAIIPAQAAGADVLTMHTLTTGVTEVDTMLNNLHDLISGLVKVIGGILCIYGIFQVGMSFSGHDPSQRIQGLMCIAGAILIFFSPEILTAIQS